MRIKKALGALAQGHEECFWTVMALTDMNA